MFYWATTTVTATAIVGLITHLLTVGSNQQGTVRPGLPSTMNGPPMMKSYQFSHDVDAVVYNPDTVNLSLSLTVMLYTTTAAAALMCMHCCCLPAGQVGFGWCDLHSHSFLGTRCSITVEIVRPMVALMMLLMATLEITLLITIMTSLMVTLMI